jgi:exopolyphosphatase / guanosine-5'-triphosphate,3'-diphosphate pyrophosphatase
MSERLAVIDLGTNTFHLLIAEAAGSTGFRIIHRHRHYVHLGRSGLDRIDPAAIPPALEVCRRFGEQLRAYGVRECRALGTEALRRADNGADFLNRLTQVLGYPVTLIDGLEEARLIARGVGLLLPRDAPPALVMDIGGGSVEFIHLEEGQMRWRGSFPVGVAVLRHQFHRHEPISPEERRAIDNFLEQHLAPLVRAQSGSGSLTLIGAAGIYEVLARHTRAGTHGGLHILDIGDFRIFSESVMRLDLARRRAHPAIPRERAELFPVALALIRWILDHLPVNGLQASPYAMKEGALHEMLLQRKEGEN